MIEIQLASDEKVQGVTFGKDSKFMIVQYNLMIEIYKVQELLKGKTIPKVVRIDEGLIENISDLFIKTSDSTSDMSYSIYLACRVYAE